MAKVTDPAILEAARFLRTYRAEVDPNGRRDEGEWAHALLVLSEYIREQATAAMVASEHAP